MVVETIDFGTDPRVAWIAEDPVLVEPPGPCEGPSKTRSGRLRLPERVHEDGFEPEQQLQ